MAKVCEKCGKEIKDGAQVCLECGAVNGEAKNSEAKSKMAAGLLGIFLGSLGIHNFYLGNTQRAIIQLLVTLIGGTITCGLAAIAMEVWGIVEGIQILTGKIDTDANGVKLAD